MKKEIRQQELGNMPVPKLLLKMAIPMIIAMVVNGLYYLVDAAFVGWAVNATALGSLAVVFPLQMFAVALGTMIGIGAAAIVSRKLGENKREDAEQTVKNAFLFAGILGIILPIILMLFKTNVLHFMGVTNSTIRYADEYYSVIIPGFILIFLSFLEVNIIRAEGNAKLAAFGMFLGSVFNIGLDALFILGFKMGTAGAAWGTVTARFITTILLASYYLSKKSIVSIMTPNWPIKLPIIKKISILGVGPLLNQLGFAILAVVMNILIQKYGTEADMSAYGVIARILVFVTLPLMGVAQGFQPIVGYNYGAGNFNRIKKSITMAFLYAFVLGSIMFVFIMFMPESVLGLFTNDIDIIKNGASLLQISMMITPFIGWQLIAYFYFMSIHKPVPSLIISLFRQVIFILPLLVVLPLILGRMGIWIAYPIADTVSIIVSTFMLIKSQIKHQRLELNPNYNNRKEMQIC
jgi:putative MATE family efflux protein